MTMNARTPPNTFSQIRREVAKEADKLRPAIFAEAAEELIPQALAFFVWTIHVNYGWGKKRLLKLVDDLHETDYLMDNPSRLHHRFDPLDCERELKEKFGIDLRKEFPVRIEHKGKR